MKYKVVLLFLLSLSFLQAQDSLEVKNDLKVGLVLSGGGAKGLAHIGALKEIEKAGIRIDYVGGTSMGAIIGALYASGYNATQLDSIFQQLDFETLISDDVPRRARTFYEKEEVERYAVTLPFDQFKLRFPSGISKGQNVYNLLSKLMVHVKDIEDFNKLPIPFVCVATNVETGTPKLFRRGYLPKAVTASGALPSLFAPVKINDTLYIDGGVVNNYPIDEVRAMGADIVIGVDVQDTLRTRQELESALDILVQINNYRTIESMVEKSKKTDVYINPEIDKYTVVSFDEGNEIINAGETAAQKFSKNLQIIASQQKKRAPFEIPYQNRESVFIESVEIVGNENYTRSYILSKLRLRAPAEVSYADFNDGVNNLSATGNFDKIDYRFFKIPDKENTFRLVFDLEESDSKTILRLGAHYDELYRTAALVNLTRKRLFMNNDVASFDFIVGDNIRYRLDYFIDKGYYWSIGFNSTFQFFEESVNASFLDNEIDEESGQNFQLNRIDLEYDDLTNQIIFQTVLKRVFKFGLGAEHKWLKYFSETIGVDDQGLPRTTFENTDYFSAFGVLQYDSLDDKFFPTNGFYFDGDFHWYLFASGLNENFEPFSIAKAKAGYALPLAEAWSVYITTEGGFTLGGSETRSLDFFLGGYGFVPTNNIMPMLGLEPLELRGNTYLKSGLDIDFEFARKNHLVFSANIANIGDDLFENGTWIDGIDISSFAVGYGLETFLGPMEIKYAYSPELDRDTFHFNIGYRF